MAWASRQAPKRRVWGRSRGKSAESLQGTQRGFSGSPPQGSNCDFLKPEKCLSSQLCFHYLR